MKDRKKPDKFLLPHGMPSDDREFAFSSRVPPKALKIKAPYKSWHYQYTPVCPAVWKQTFSLGTDEEVARLRVQQLFPSADLRIRNHHGRAEALLQSCYGLQVLSAGQQSMST